MKKIILLSFLAFILITNIRAKDFYFYSEYSGLYSNNIFLNSSNISDYVSDIYISANYETKNINLYLDTSLNLFTENTDFNSYLIEPGIEFINYLKGRSYLYLNFNFKTLNYRELFTDFNYYGPGFQAGIKYYTNNSTLIKAGYNLLYRKYYNFNSFDFYNNNLFFEINKFFKTQTTLRFQTGFNYRYYPHIFIQTEDEPTINYYGNRDIWYNRGMPYNTMGIPNVFGLIRIAQGIGTKTGIYTEFELRKNFRGLEEAESLIQNSYVIYPYNDNYLWDGFRISAGISFIPFYEISFKINASYYKKNYPGIYVMDEEGIVIEPLIERKDDLFRLNFSISKKIKKTDLYFKFIYSKNNSNDYYFTYNLLTITAGIGYSF